MKATNKKYRDMDRAQLESKLNRILDNYMKIYDELNEVRQNMMTTNPDIPAETIQTERDLTWIKELTLILNGIDAILEVRARDKYIHESYALEKIRHTAAMAKRHQQYWESRNQIEEEQDE